MKDAIIYHGEKFLRADLKNEKLLLQLQKRYPAAVRASMEKEEDEYGNWKDVQSSAKPIQELEKVVVYEVLTALGPDVEYEKIGKIIPKVRSRSGGDILKAFQQKKLSDILTKMGLFS